MAARVFKGNTADPVPQGGMPEQIRVVKEQFGVGELVFVGDRVRGKAPEQEALSAQGFSRSGVADELVCGDAGGVEDQGRRYVLPKNEQFEGRVAQVEC